MPGQHANLSPSSAERWIGCPASVRMIAEHVEPGTDDSSVYAREGTLAHALGELEAAHRFGKTTRRQYVDAKRVWLREFDAEAAAQDYPEGTLEDMQAYIEGYVDFLADRLDLHPHSEIMLEQRMDSGVPQSWGTSDAVIFSPTHVEIVDYKHGQGVRVAAGGNPQLRLYGCGALDTYGDILGTTEEVTVTVYQPRVHNYDSETLTATELRAWRSEVAIPGALRTDDPEAPFGPSMDACRWCPVKNICRARMEASTAEDFGTAPETLSREEIGEVLHRVEMIQDWCKDVKQYALDQIYVEGQDIPGWKVVRAAGRRSITDHAAAVQTLIDAGHPAEKVANFKTKPLGVLEKLVGKKELPTVLGGLLTKSDGKESLVPESDKRDGITRQGDAAADFAAPVEEVAV